MNRTELACCTLLATAFLLAGLLITALNQRGGIMPSADASMVLTRSNLTIMTAKTKSDEEALFILDNFSQRLSVFTVDLGKKRLELAHAPLRLNALFNKSEKSRGGGGGRRGR